MHRVRTGLVTARRGGGGGVGLGGVADAARQSTGHQPGAQGEGQERARTASGEAAHVLQQVLRGSGLQALGQGLGTVRHRGDALAHQIGLRLLTGDHAVQVVGVAAHLAREPLLLGLHLRADLLLGGTDQRLHLVSGLVLHLAGLVLGGGREVLGLVLGVVGHGLRLALGLARGLLGLALRLVLGVTALG